MYKRQVVGTVDVTVEVSDGRVLLIVVGCVVVPVSPVLVLSSANTEKPKLNANIELNTTAMQRTRLKTFSFFLFII